MKRQPKKSRRREKEPQLWTFTRAQAACPYIRSVVSSLREQTLEIQGLERRIQQLNERPGRPDRQTLIQLQELLRELQEAQIRLEEVAEELDALNIFALNPVQGQTLLPFVNDDQLAWYIFDLFDPKPLRFWRYQEDSLETRRPIAALQQGTTETPWRA
jgi:hypothetical protein